MNGKIFGREPALIAAFVATLIQVLSALILPLTTEQQGLLNGAVALLLGLVVAAQVSLEKAVPAVIGLLQGLAAVGVAFGFDISANTVSAITAVIAAGAAMFIRTQVVAPVGAEGASVVKSL
jgi:hypothetical protein